jgi:hypothetical protein
VAAALAGATASKIQYGMGSDGISLGSSTPYCQLFMPPAAFVNPPAGAYPIVGLSYWLFYGKHQVRSGAHHYSDLKGLIKYLESNAGVALLAPIEYSPLPASTRKAVGAAFKGNTSQNPCFNP